MTAPHLRCWQQLPRMSVAVMRLRNIAARGIHAAADRWHVRHGLRYRLALEAPLPRYGLWIVLDGGMGQIEMGLECAAVLPELGVDVLEAIANDDQRREALEWLLMPWLDELEALLGCELRLAALTFRRSVPSNDVVSLLVCVADGRRAHVALTGSGLPRLADALGTPETLVPAWCRVDVTSLLSIQGLTTSEMRALVPGALLRTRPSTLQININNGDVRMAADWLNEEGLQVGERAGSAALQAPGCEPDAPLIALEQLTFDVDVVLATTQLSVEALGGLCKGSILPLFPPVDGQRVVLSHRGGMFARGELAYVEDEMVVMITECFTSSPA